MALTNYQKLALTNQAINNLKEQQKHNTILLQYYSMLKEDLIKSEKS